MESLSFVHYAESYETYYGFVSKRRDQLALPDWAFKRAVALRFCVYGTCTRINYRYCPQKCTLYGRLRIRHFPGYAGYESGRRIYLAFIPAKVTTGFALFYGGCGHSSHFTGAKFRDPLHQPCNII